MSGLGMIEVYEYGRVWALFMPILYIALYKGLEPPWVLVPEGVLGPAPLDAEGQLCVRICVYSHAHL